jgi:hypothetical protein
MKLRIKDNALRIRLTRSEVGQLAQTGMVRASTPFSNATFHYSVIATVQDNPLEARIEPYRMEMLVRQDLVKNWPDNNEVGFKASTALPDGTELKLVLEKDFVCLDDSEEDQSDNYANPNAVCIPSGVTNQSDTIINKQGK